MDFYAETEKRKERLLEQIGELCYRHYMACKVIENAEKEIAEIDAEIAKREAALREADQAQRNFDTYLAVKEGAMTKEDLAKAIEDGGRVEEPKEKTKKGERPGKSGSD